MQIFLVSSSLHKVLQSPGRNQERVVLPLHFTTVMTASSMGQGFPALSCLVPLTLQSPQVSRSADIEDSHFLAGTIDV